MSAWLLHDGVQTRGWRLYIKICSHATCGLHKTRELRTAALHKNMRPRRPDIHICPAHKSEQADNADFLKDEDRRYRYEEENCNRSGSGAVSVDVDLFDDRVLQHSGHRQKRDNRRRHQDRAAGDGDPGRRRDPVRAVAGKVQRDARSGRF